MHLSRILVLPGVGSWWKGAMVFHWGGVWQMLGGMAEGLWWGSMGGGRGEGFSRGGCVGTLGTYLLTFFMYYVWLVGFIYFQMRRKKMQEDVQVWRVYVKEHVDSKIAYPTRPRMWMLSQSGRDDLTHLERLSYFSGTMTKHRRNLYLYLNSHSSWYLYLNSF